MFKTIFSLIAIILLLISGCTNESPTVPQSDLVVVRGYIYAGEPVDDIQLTSTLPLGSEETQAPPINDAQVSLIKDGTQYDLVSSAGDSGYYHYDGNELKVETSDIFQIQVKHEDFDVFGFSEVPEAPKNVTISSSTLKFPDFETMRELRQQGISMDSIRASMMLTVNWEQEEDALYYILVENINENPVPVESQFSKPPREFISQPTARNEYTVNAMMMTHLGKHIVKVFRVNQEYADLYQSRNQDSRDLNEPLTNIEGGLGIFSAFNCDSLFFDFEQN
jgi:hypothetical protein